MGWTADTQAILGDATGEQGTVFTISTISTVYSTGVAVGHRTATVRDTATGLALPQKGKFIRDKRGELIRVDWNVFFLPTVLVSVGNRMSRSGVTEYLEVLSVIRYSDHLEVLASEVEGR